MIELSIQSCLEKIEFLERRVGSLVKYDILQQFHVNGHSIDDLHRAATTIATFVGLGNLDFVVRTTIQPSGIGAQISLDNRNQVLIVIHNALRDYGDAILATLSHEISHKWLHLNAVSWGNYALLSRENEVLTDLTAVFLGLGKLMLNGCECHISYSQSRHDGMRVTEEHVRSGYLTREELAFAYALIGAMRNLPTEVLLENLNSEAEAAVLRVKQEHAEYFDQAYQDGDFLTFLCASIENAVSKGQGLLAELDQHARYFQRALCDHLETFAEEQHEILISQKRVYEKALDVKTDNPAHVYLHNLRGNMTVTKAIHQLKKVCTSTEAYLKHARSMGQYLSANEDYFPLPSADMFSVVSCPRDGRIMQFPENAGRIRATCPECKYSFTANVAAPKYQGKKQKDERKGGLFSRLLSLMRNGN